MNTLMRCHILWRLMWVYIVFSGLSVRIHTVISYIVFVSISFQKGSEHIRTVLAKSQQAAHILVQSDEGLNQRWIQDFQTEGSNLLRDVQIGQFASIFSKIHHQFEIIWTPMGVQLNPLPHLLPHPNPL